MAISAHGTLLKMGDGATPVEAFATIAEVLDISGPGVTFGVEVVRGDGDVTRTLPGDGDPVEMTFDINYVEGDTQTRLREASASQTETSFQVVFPTDPVETATFTGYVTGFLYSAPVAGVLRASVTITLASAMAMS